MIIKKDNNEITIIYKIEPDREYIKIFDSTFVKNNKDSMKIKYEEKEYELNEFFNIKDCKNKEKLEIKLFGINNIKSMKNMFKKCSLLLSTPDFDKIDTTNIKSFSHLFDKCSLMKNFKMEYI